MHFIHPMTMKNVTVPFPVALGPMAGITDGPFRRIASLKGCGLFYTEMVSAKALYYQNAGTETLLSHGEAERPIGVQLFGSDPDILTEEALKLEERFDFIDVNLGCPVPKIVKNHEGSYLLTEPEKVKAIFTKLCQNVKKPVTAKIRKGFYANECTAPFVASLLEDCGVSMIAVHGRTREQYYSGKADWDAIRAVKESVKIPVIANGDIQSAYDAERILSETGCDGIMIARAADGNPWIFEEIKAYNETGVIPPKPSYEEIVTMILSHAGALIKEKGDHIGIMEMRRHAAAYISGTKNAAKKRVLLNEVNSLEELRNVLRSEEMT